MTETKETNGAGKRPGQIILGWWSTALGKRKTGAQKGLSARLRRGDDISVLCHKEVHDLAAQLGLGQYDGAKIARLARVLAHVREHSNATLPRKLGGKEPVLSPLRFDRLIHSEAEDLETAIRRALPMVDNKANVAHLGEALLFWTDKTRTNWCFEYYGADAPMTPTAEDISK